MFANIARQPPSRCPDHEAVVHAMMREDEYGLQALILPRAQVHIFRCGDRIFCSVKGALRSAERNAVEQAVAYVEQNAPGDCERAIVVLDVAGFEVTLVR